MNGKSHEISRVRGNASLRLDALARRLDSSVLEMVHPAALAALRRPAKEQDFPRSGRCDALPVRRTRAAPSSAARARSKEGWPMSIYYIGTYDIHDPAAFAAYPPGVL